MPKNTENIAGNGRDARVDGHDDPKAVLLPNSHRSGPGDTPWELTGGPKSGRFWKMLAASLIVHAFLTPGPALLGLVAMLPALDLSGAEEVIEVELTALPVGAVAPIPEEPDVPEPAPEPEPNAPIPEPEVDEAPEEPAPAPEAAKPVADEPVAPPEEGAPKETKAFGDPVALAGSAGSIADSNANVRLFLFNDVVREHPLGEKVGELLRRTPQWRDFFGPSQIDPVADIDRVLIAGPQLRNSSQVVAVVQHNMERERIKTAFDNLVARQGKWIDKAAMIAEARADRADRIFAAPNDNVVVVAPLKLEDQVRALGASTRFPPSANDVAVTAYIITPANVVKGTGIQLPETIKWARLDIRPLASGGAILKILAEDEDEGSAQTNALFFEQLIKAVTTVDPSKMKGFGAVASLLGVKKQEYLKSVEFTSKGSEIHGTIEVTKNQLLLAADLLAGYLPKAPTQPSGMDPDTRNGASSDEALNRKEKKRGKGKQDNGNAASPEPEPRPAQPSSAEAPVVPPSTNTPVPSPESTEPATE